MRSGSGSRTSSASFVFFTTVLKQVVLIVLQQLGVDAYVEAYSDDIVGLAHTHTAAVWGYCVMITIANAVGLQMKKIKCFLPTCFPVWIGMLWDLRARKCHPKPSKLKKIDEVAKQVTESNWLFGLDTLQTILGKFTYYAQFANQGHPCLWALRNHLTARLRWRDDNVDSKCPKKRAVAANTSAAFPLAAEARSDFVRWIQFLHDGIPLRTHCDRQSLLVRVDAASFRNGGL